MHKSYLIFMVLRNVFVTVNFSVIQVKRVSLHYFTPIRQNSVAFLEELAKGKSYPCAF